MFLKLDRGPYFAHRYLTASTHAYCGGPKQTMAASRCFSQRQASQEYGISRASHG
jgi:hypothetical protein